LSPRAGKPVPHAVDPASSQQVYLLRASSKLEGAHCSAPQPGRACGWRVEPGWNLRFTTLVGTGSRTGLPLDFLSELEHRCHQGCDPRAPCSVSHLCVGLVLRACELTAAAALCITHPHRRKIGAMGGDAIRTALSMSMSYVDIDRPMAEWPRCPQEYRPMAEWPRCPQDYLSACLRRAKRAASIVSKGWKTGATCSRPGLFTTSLPLEDELQT
jgi:hypothetical protein